MGCVLFSDSPKHQLELENSFEGATAKELVSSRKTRWVARIDALNVFFDLFPAIIKTLEVIKFSLSLPSLLLSAGSGKLGTKYYFIEYLNMCGADTCYDNNTP